MKKIFMALGLTCLAGVAHAEANGEQFTHFAGVELSGSHSFRNVMNAFGDAPLVTKAEYNRLDGSICYKTQGGYVQFLSAQLTGNPEVMGFGLSEKAPDKQCVVIADGRDPGPLEVGGLKLGMSKNDYRALVSDKSQTGNEMLSAMYLYGIPTAEGVYLKGQVDITPEFERGRLVAVQVWKTITR